MRFHLAQLSVTLNELERSNRGQAFQRVITWKPFQIQLNVLMVDKKSMVFQLVTFALT